MFLFGNKKKESDDVNVIDCESPTKLAITKAIKRSVLDRKQIADEIIRLIVLKNNLLKVEGHQGKIIDDAIDDLKTAEIDVKYPRLSLDIMKWRTKEGWPALAFFSSTDRFCSFTSDWYYDEWKDSSISPALDSIFTDNFYFNIYKYVFNTLQRRCKMKRTHITRSIKTEFMGLIPERIKLKLRDTRDFDQILLFTDAPKWKIEEIVHPTNPDPLLVGIKGKNMWLIDSFDLMPVEEAIKAEWATGPIK